MMDKRQTKVKVLTSQLLIDDMFTTLKMAGKDKSIAGAIEAGVRGRERSIVGYALWGAQRGRSKTMRKRKNENAVINVFLLTRRQCFIACGLKHSYRISHFEGARETTNLVYRYPQYESPSRDSLKHYKCTLQSLHHHQ